MILDITGREEATLWLEGRYAGRSTESSAKTARISQN